MSPPDFMDIVLRPTMVLLLATVLALALRRFSAAARHLVWSAALCGILVIPVLAPAMPGFRMPVSAAVAQAISRIPFVGVVPPAASEATAGINPPGSAVPTPHPSGAGVPWRWIWLGGMIVSLSTLFVRYRVLSRIAKAARPGNQTPLGGRLDAIRDRLGIRRKVQLLIGEAGAMPMTWGYYRPRILLPAAAVDWPEDQTDAVMLHELMHVRRADVVLQRCAELARAVFWFNPLAWFAARRLLVEREHACDDAVLNSGVRRSDYAHQLLAMANALRTARGTGLALPMARRSQMTGRLLAILDEDRSRSSREPAPPIVAGLAVVVALAATGFQPVAAPVPFTPPDAGPGAAPAVVPVGGRHATSGCWPPVGSNTRHNKNEDPGLLTATWRTSRCIGSLRIEGSAMLRRDSAGFAALSPGGQILIEEVEGDVRHRFEVVPGQPGRLKLAGSIDDRPARRDEIEDWFRANLPPLLRFTKVQIGIAGEQ